MIAVDTNVIVRLLTRDDDAQFKKAKSFFATKQIFIPATVILETEWVLRYAYNFTPLEICAAFTKLFGLPNVSLSRPETIFLAIELTKQGLDFADALHLSASQNSDIMVTFDTDLIRQAKGLTKCKVQKP